MPVSMTGVGLATGPTEIGDLRIEVRTVNGRSLAPKLRLSSACAGLENAIERAIRARLQRGTVTVIVERDGVAGGGPEPEAIAAAVQQLTEIATAAGLAPPTLADALTWMSQTSRQEPRTSRPLPQQMAALLEAALDDLEEHRRADGRSTVAAMEEQLQEFEAQLAVATTRAPEIVDHYRNRLLQRVTDFLEQHVEAEVAKVDLVREVAIHADRVDVAEELQRLRAHVDEFRAALGSDGAAGRRLEFLLQELLRETNTLGSKSPDTALSHTVVAMKSGIDRLKEQAANLE